MRGVLLSAPLGFFFVRRVCAPACILSFCAFASSVVFSGCATVGPGSAASPAATALSVVPAEIDFESVVVGQRNSQALQITNTSTKNVDLSTLHVTGASFTLLSARAPVVLAPGKQITMNIVFAPSAAAAEKGALIISGPTLLTPIRVPLAGSGVKPDPALQASPSAINFGSHALNSSAFQTVTFTNSGNVSLTVHSVSLSGAGFSIAGVSAGVSLAPQQRLEFQVWYHPTVAGSVAATLIANVSALTSPLRLAVAGSATTSPTAPSSASSHSVALDWNSSTSSVVGYHIYRGGVSGGPYGRIDNSVVNSLSYRDANVQSGGRYFYVVTALGTDGVESPFSNEVAADIPNP